ncbi:hypothetical protein BGZ46_010825 [Entomortierella lignicola]|nr:hypothetical protein BGZ46_010825 [Entomortierella lignicola]
MDPDQSSADAAYMSLLTRKIPGVGNSPLDSTTPKLPTLLTNSSTKGLTSNLSHQQQTAINTLQDATKDALFVSEGEEQFQAVHIIPSHSDTPAAVTSSSATPSSPPLPTSSELLKLLQDAHLIPTDHNNDTDVQCEQSSNLNILLNNSYPGANHIAAALRDLFQNDQGQLNPNLALYRVTLPSSPTRVHLWILGWIDHHLFGFHTISIES